MTTRSTIIGTGRYIGETEFTTAAVLKNFGIDPANPKEEWVKKELVKTHRIRMKAMDPETSTSTLFVQAGKNALLKAGLRADQMDLLICVTDTPDFICPATSARVQHGLGATKAGFFDLNSSCAGFTIALNMADCFLRGTDEANYVMIIGGNHYSRFISPMICLET